MAVTLYALQRRRWSMTASFLLHTASPTCTGQVPLPQKSTASWLQKVVEQARHFHRRSLAPTHPSRGRLMPVRWWPARLHIPPPRLPTGTLPCWSASDHVANDALAVNSFMELRWRVFRICVTESPAHVERGMPMCIQQNCQHGATCCSSGAVILWTELRSTLLHFGCAGPFSAGPASVTCKGGSR